MSLLDIQKGVITLINAEFDFTSEKAFVPVFKAKDMNGNVKVVVVATEVIDTKRMNRGNLWEEKPIIQIGVGQKVDFNADPPIDEEVILQLAIDVRNFLKDQEVVTGPSPYDYPLLGVDFVPFYDMPTLMEDDMILSIISITFKEFTN